MWLTRRRRSGPDAAAARHHRRHRIQAAFPGSARLLPVQAQPAHRALGRHHARRARPGLHRRRRRQGRPAAGPAPIRGRRDRQGHQHRRVPAPVRRDRRAARLDGLDRPGYRRRPGLANPRDLPDQPADQLCSRALAPAQRAGGARRAAVLGVRPPRRRAPPPAAAPGLARPDAAPRRRLLATALPAQRLGLPLPRARPGQAARRPAHRAAGRLG